MASVSKRKWNYKGEPREAWVVRYFDENGKHKSKQFERKKDADAYLRRVTRETEDGVHVSDGVTVTTVCDEFMKAQEIRLMDGRIGKGTVKNLSQAVNRSIIPFLGKRQLHEVSPVDVEAFYADMVKGGLSPVTAKKRVIDFGQICDFGSRRGWLKVNPVVEARKQLRGITEEPIRTFTPEQVLALIRSVDARRKGQHPRTHRLVRCFVHLAAFCGLRWGEICGLTVQRVRLDEGVIEVRHSLTTWDELKEPKTRSGLRDVEMPPHVVKLLRDWLDEEYVANPRQLLFRVWLSRTDKGPGGQIHPGSFRAQMWLPLLRDAGISAEGEDDWHHFHALRHFAASWMIANGMPVMDTAQALGHKRFDMTLQTYAHPMVGRAGRREITDRMAGRLLAGPVIEGEVVTQE